jgi:microcystin-dependent protein
MPTTSLPAGTIISYLGAEATLNALASQGWLLCDGSSVGTLQYPNLWQAIGDKFGSTGMGAFNLPDLRGMFLRGVDSSGTVDPDYRLRTSPVAGNGTVVGPVVGSRQEQQLRNHQHYWDQNFGQISISGSDINVQLAPNSPYAPGGGLLGRQPTTDTDGGGNETRPVNVYVYYLISTG